MLNVLPPSALARPKPGHLYFDHTPFLFSYISLQTWSSGFNHPVGKGKCLKIETNNYWKFVI